MYTYSVLLLVVATVTGTAWGWGCNGCTCSYSPCGGTGWTLVADLDMRRITEQCPPSLTFYDVANLRLCGRSTDGCDSVFFQTYNIPYDEVCGRVLAYQYASNDAFGHASIRDDVNAAYVDGVSITRGNPREHIWTYASGLMDTRSYGDRHWTQCPCSSNGDPDHMPSFIGDDYYCEAAISDNDWRIQFYPDDQLWDNRDCGPLETECCNVGLLPYFYRNLGERTTDYIEVRVCGDENRGNEDTRVSVVELYIR